LLALWKKAFSSARNAAYQLGIFPGPLRWGLLAPASLQNSHDTRQSMKSRFFVEAALGGLLN
jgi:hypothetical protein